MVHNKKNSFPPAVRKNNSLSALGPSSSESPRPADPVDWGGGGGGAAAKVSVYGCKPTHSPPEMEGRDQAVDIQQGAKSGTGQRLKWSGVARTAAPFLAVNYRETRLVAAESLLSAAHRLWWRKTLNSVFIFTRFVPSKNQRRF